MVGSIQALRELFYLGTISFYLIIVLAILSCITVGLRLWVRYRITKSPGWDDAAMVATLLLFICFCAFVLATLYRLRQLPRFQPDALRVTLILVQLSEVFYILTTTLLKVSLGLFFLRVLTKKWQVRIFYAILGVGVTYGCFYVFITIFACGNPAKLADTMLGNPKCLPGPFLLATGYLYGVINVIADWTFVLIPISVLIDSDLDRKSKISVSFIMALGAVGSVSSIMRMVYLHGLAFNAHGITSTTLKATIWATAEPGTGIIAASIAILRPLFRKIASDVRTKTSSHKNSRHATPSPPEDDDTIALTSRSKKNASMYSIGSEEPWSPTVVVGQANITRVISFQMINGRGSPAPSRAPSQKNRSGNGMV